MKKQLLAVAVAALAAGTSFGAMAAETTYQARPDAHVPELRSRPLRRRLDLARQVHEEQRHGDDRSRSEDGHAGCDHRHDVGGYRQRQAG